MIVTTDLQLFKILKERLGDTEAESLVQFVDNRIKENNEANLKILATKEDIADVRREIADVRNLVSETKAELIKWMFLFWIGQVAVTFGFIILYLRK